MEEVSKRPLIPITIVTLIFVVGIAVFLGLIASRDIKSIKNQPSRSDISEIEKQNISPTIDEITPELTTTPANDVVLGLQESTTFTQQFSQCDISFEYNQQNFTYEESNGGRNFFNGYGNSARIFKTNPENGTLQQEILASCINLQATTDNANFFNTVMNTINEGKPYTYDMLSNNVTLSGLTAISAIYVFYPGTTNEVKENLYVLVNNQLKKGYIIKVTNLEGDTASLLQKIKFTN